MINPPVYHCRGYEESMKAMVGAMRKANITRLVTMTAWYSDSKYPPDTQENTHSVLDGVFCLMSLIHGSLEALQAVSEATR